jgi:DnaJ-class molecular chaperone
LDGHEFTVNIDGVTECDHVLRVPGKGMPRRNGKGFGDLFLQFEVDFPDKLTNKQKEAIRMVFAEPEEGHDEGGDEL